MPKAAAATPRQEVSGEPFAPEPLADTMKSLGLVAEAPVSEARTEASISQARDLGFKPAPASTVSTPEPTTSPRTRAQVQKASGPGRQDQPAGHFHRPM